MHATYFKILSSVFFAALAIALSSCASSRYQTVRGGPQLSRTFEIASRNLSAEAVVNSVIVRGGPGSWKHDAWWDEYVVSLTNHGSTPLSIEAAELVCTSGTRSAPGDNPWRLEDESKTVWSRVRTSESVYGAVLIGTGGLVVQCVTLGCVSGIEHAGWLIEKTAAVDRRNAAGIAAEFAHRRLGLPLRIEPGQTRRGSLFFPVSPEPAVLNMSCRTAQRQWEVAVNLAPIAESHRGYPPVNNTEPVGVPLAPVGPVTVLK